MDPSCDETTKIFLELLFLNQWQKSSDKVDWGQEIHVDFFLEMVQVSDFVSLGHLG